MKLFFKALILVPVAVIVLAFAFANRQLASVLFDPFDPSTPFRLTAPTFVVLFVAVIAGVLIGGIASWMSQGRFRREARRQRAEADRLRVEVSRLREQVRPTDTSTVRLQGRTAA